MKILHLEDNPRDIELVQALLQETWPVAEITSVSTRDTFVAALDAGGWDIILSDFSLGGFDGATALQIVRARPLDTPFIFVSGTIGEDRAIEAVQAGAQDYVLKDRLKRLVPTVRRALLEYQERQQRHAAEASQRRLAAILESTPDFVGMADAHGQVFYVNAAGIRMMGLPSSVDVGHLRVGDFHPPEIGSLVEREALPAASFQGTWSGETRLRAHDGRGVPVSQVIIAHRTPDGHTEFYSTIMRDISRRKEIEDALRRSEENYHSLFDQAGDAILVVGSDLRVIDANARAHLAFGCPPAELVGLSCAELLAPADQQRLGALIDASLQGNRAAECHFLRRDGTTFPGEINLSRLSDGRILGLLRDITDRKAAESRIHEQAALLDKAREAILVTDLEGRVTYWNHGAELICGWTAAEALGRTVAELFGLELFSGESPGDTEQRREVQLRHRRGRMLSIELSTTLIRDDAGRPGGRLVIGTDVTAKKSLEEQFLRVQRLESIGMLAAGIAHDLNNILAPILMAAPMLRDRVSRPEDIRMLESVEKSAERGAGLVRQILGFAQGIGGEPRIVQIKHLVRDIAGFVASAFPKSIRYEEDLARDLWTIKANPTQLHQVLLNLCVNARDAMPSGGSLRLRADNCVLDERAAAALPGARPGAWLRVTVEDTGSGIDTATLERIWDPFFTTKSPGKGTGLGLSTVRGIIESHGGFVLVRSAPGEGSTFTVHLPPTENSTIGRPTAPSPSFDVHGIGELVLVVDDEASIRDVITATLAHHGYRVLAACDGAEAVALFAPRASEIQLVITDFSMPHLDGGALAGVVRRINPGVRLLAISGLDQDAEAAGPASLFAGNFLLKPFRAEALLAAVSKLLRAR